MPASTTADERRADQPLAWPLFGNWRRVGLVCALFLVSRLLVIGSGQIAWNHFAKSSDTLPPHSHLADLFYRADAAWYLDVAIYGYRYQLDPATGQADGNVGFYPVFPFTVRALHLLGLDRVVAGYLVANVALLLACFLLWELAERELRSPLAAVWAVAFALFCPGGAWFSMLFAESPFLLLFLVAIIACRRRRWWTAAAAGYLLALTRTVGVMACVFVALEALADWHDRSHPSSSAPAGDARPTPGAYARWLLAIAAPVLGYATFLLFMQLHFGDWHAQRNVLASRWPDNAHLSMPWTAIARDWAPMHNGKRIIIYGLLAWGSLLSALSYPALRRWSYPAVAFALLFIYVTAANHSPMARYLSVVVPIHLALAWLAVRRPWLGGVMLAGSAALMCVITGLMVNGYVFY